MINRLITMSRFAEPDEHKVVSYCTYCGEELYQGQEVTTMDGDDFCNRDCLIDSLDYIERYLE